MGGVRAGHLSWLAWPGYLWIAVMFYLLITLLVLEIPRLVALRLWARNPGEGSDHASRSPNGLAAEPLPTGEPALSGATSGHAGAPAASEHGGAPAASEHGGEPSLSGRASGHGSESHGGGEPTLGAGGAATVDTVDEAGAAGESGGASREPGAGGVAGHGGAGQGPGMDRRLLLARGTAIFAGLTAASITGYGVKTATGAPQIDRVQLPIAKLPRSMDGTRLAVVSDIHIGPLTGVEHARRITRVINSVNADLVCVVGDLVDGSVAELGRFAAPLGGIESRHGAFFVTGNHEYYSGAEEWVEEVARLGIRPLRNERVEINGLDLAGVNDLTGEEQGDGPDFARALGDRDTTRPVVLMAHQPVAAKEAAPYGVDLQVSGHTHGGQMAPFNMLVRLQQPVVSGFGKVDGVPVYVTNGAGFWGPPVRVGAPPQVTVIELRVA
ncbi:metallophosphoesterase [Actinoplanes hulinensis]|uniref:metallophosphoesterase n=1 Tax=Actinoplanes hulinensis TaxID=1144547 RepID=UPI003FD793BF